MFLKINKFHAWVVLLYVGGVFMGGSLWVSGKLYTAFGGHAFLAMAGLSLAGAGTALILRYHQRSTIME